MTKNYILTLFVFLTSLVSSFSQVANYNFAPSAGSYTALVAPTNVFPSGWDDNTAVSVTLGFTFTFNSVAYTSVFVHPNGYITFGSSTSGYLPISGGSAVSGVVSAWGRDLQAQNTAPLGSVDYQSAAGVFTVQWSNTRRYNSTTINAEIFEMQIKLIQATGVIQIIYGSWTNAVSATTTNNGEVGLRGSSSSDFKNLGVLSAGSWAAPTPGVLITETCFYNESNVVTKPSTGQTYTFTPPPPCVTPPSQPTALMLTPTLSTIAGSFTAAAGAPSGYLVVRTLTNVAPTPPVNGTTYVPGSSALGGVIVSSGATTTFTATGLAPTTPYYFWIYSFNNTACSVIAYQTASPLSGNSITLSCSIPASTRTVGPTGTYATITAALTDLNTNGLTGPVILELQSTYLSTAEPTFPIVVPQIPCISAVNNVVIRPQAGATGLSIISANATGTINYDGGDYVSFDGRAGGAGVSQLTISNTNITGYAIQFINNATFNTIKYCQVTGVNTGSTSGVILFNTAVGFSAGNSNNTIDNCNIHDDVTTPTNLIYCNGTVTGGYATENNNITISNCLIHDWFNASSTTASAAINVVAGASDWTITSNSFYQSVPRTFTMTTATDQGAIFIASATFGFNFNISNNYIGGSAPLCGGSPLTWTGVSTGTPTARMIRFAAAAGTPISTISNNTIANIAITTATTNNLSGMISHNSGDCNITNNTIGSQTATGNITFTETNATVGVFFLPIGYGLGSVVSKINVSNNNIGGITVNNTSTGSVSFRVIYGQPIALSTVTVSGNTIGGTVANSIQQLSNNITSCIMILNPTLDNVVTNNTIRNITHNNIGVTGSLTGINIQSNGRHTVTGNTIFNLTSNSTNIAINNAASVVGLTMTASTTGGTVISNNTIYNLTNTDAAVAGAINGIYVGTAAAPQTNTTISKNFVHSFNLNSPLGQMTGIFLPNVGNALCYNNMVRLGLDVNGADITQSLQINGIYKAATASMGVYFNTVYIGGTGVTGGAVNSYAFRRSATGLADTVMNNIFVNARSNGSGTGKHYSVFQFANTTLLENFNIMQALGTGGVLGLLNVTDYATLALWQAASNADWNSISSDPKLINPTGSLATVDLHIQPASATPVEGAGYNIPLVTQDIDAQTRSGLTPVDIGADAGNFVLADLAPPAIYYTPLIGTCSTGDRTLANVNITDATGVPIAGTLRPRIYYKKNAGSYFSQPGTLNSGTGTNGLWTFTIVAADMGGLVSTDVVSYYIIAQDNVATPNIGSNPAGVIATDVNTVVTPPITLNIYSIIGTSLSGTYTVGAAGNYATLTAAVTAYNSACLGGPVLFSLIDATYPSETFPITINANPFASAVNTLTIKPAAGNNVTISGLVSVAPLALIVLNGADYVTIDGSNGATANTICPPSAASRNLTLMNTSTSTTSAVIWIQSILTGFNSATNNTVKNTNLVGSLNTQTLFGIGMGSSTTGISTASLGFGNNNNSFINNNISATQYGIYTQGPNLSNKNTGNIINQNLINTIAPNNVRNGGIFLGFEDGIQVNGNNISEISYNSSPDGFGIAAGLTSISTSGFIGNEVTNATISYNKIGTILNTGTFSAVGISVANCQSGTNSLFNNMISGVFANGTSGDFAAGIFIGGGPGSTTKIYYNTVSMSRSDILTGAAPTYGLALGGVQPIVDVRDNIFSCTGNNGTGINIAYGLAYTGNTGAYQNLTSNYNDLYVSGLGASLGVTGSLAAVGAVTTGIQRPTLAAWQAETGSDQNSLNIAPTFTSGTDVHLLASATSNNCLDGQGTPIVGITSDIDCETRNAVTPDMGADEFTPTTPFALTFTESSGTPNDGTIICGSPVTFTVSGGGTYLWSTGATTPTLVVNPNATTTYSVTITIPGACTKVFSQLITVLPLPAAIITPSTFPLCPGSTVTLTTSGGGTYLWSTGGTGPSIVVNPLVNTTYSVTVTSPFGCTAIGSLLVTVLPTPTLTETHVEPTTCVSTNGSINLTVGGAVGPYTYNWATPNGSGLVNGIEDQTGLSVGTYFVTVTAANGCTNTLSITLNGPGNCGVCPTMDGTFTTSGSPNVCTAGNMTVTVTGLTSMGVTYGIIFKYYPSAVADPYTGGTVWATVPNASLTSLGTVATATAAAPPAGTYVLYAILTPSPTDPVCRPSRNLNLTVNPNPSTNAVANQTYCVGSTVPSIVFTSPTPGASFAWTRTAEAIGAPLSGSGPVPSFVTTNGGTAPLTSTFTVTASFTAGGVTCFGTPITFTITVNPSPTVNTVANQAYCVGSTVPSIVFTTPTTGGTIVYNWTRTTGAIGLAPTSGVGAVPSFVATNAGTAPLSSTFSVNASITNNGVTCTGPTMQFTITINPTPQVNPQANITTCHNTLTGPINFTTTVPGTVFNWTNSDATIGLGASGTGNIPQFTAINTGPGTKVATIMVTPTFTNGGVTCTGTKITFTITITPPPVASCKNATIYLNASGIATLLNSDVDNGSTGGTVTLSKTTFNCSNVGPNVVTLTVTDACGKTATCTSIVTVVDNLPPVINGTIAPIVKVECDQTIPAAPTVTATDNCSATLTFTETSNQSPWLQLCEHYTYQITRLWVAKDPSGNTTTKQQIVQVGDSKAPKMTMIPVDNLYANCDESEAHGCPIPIDNCDQTPSLLFEFHYEPYLGLDGCTNSYTVFRKWTAGDKCGNTTVVTQTVYVVDHENPELTCPANIEITSSKPIAVTWKAPKAHDNCDGDLVAKQIAGPKNGSEFNPGTTTKITYVTEDNCGNTDTCSFTITIVKGIIISQGAKISGTIKNMNGGLIENAEVDINGDVNQFTNSVAGAYAFANITKGSTEDISVSKITNPLEGVNTLDLVYITNHILGKKALNSPYKLLAADVNNNGSITTADLVELRKLILHITDKFANVESWEFLPTTTVFTNPANPWKNPIVSTVHVDNIQADQTANFDGIKMGDVTWDAVGNASGKVEVKTNDNYALKAENKEYRTGETVELSVNGKNIEGMKGLQFTIEYNPASLEYVGIKGMREDIGEENFGMRYMESGKITGSIDLKSEKVGEEMFKMVFKAKENGSLLNSIKMTSSVTRAEAYTKSDETNGVSLSFTQNGKEIVITTAVLYQNEPNPFENSTMIRFDMPESQEATLGIYNVDGKIVKELSGLYEKGEHKVNLSKEEFPASGVYYYQLKTNNFNETKKMMFIK